MRRKGVRLATLSICALAAVAACDPPGMSRARVNIQGAFFPDGSCSVSADGVALFGPADSARTRFDLETPAVTLPRYGLGLYMIHCMPLLEPAANSPDARTDRMFFLTFSGRIVAQQPLGPYAMVPINDALSHEGLSMDGSYYDSRHYAPGKPGTGYGGGAGTMSLRVVSGSALFTRLGDQGVVGTFHYQAVRDWRFP